MAKSKPGLPEGFHLDVDSPSKLGDYLDEDFTGNAAKVMVTKRAIVPQPSPQPLPPKPAPAIIAPEPVSVQHIPPTPTNVLSLAEVRKRETPKSSPFKRPPRTQCNMEPETKKMFGEILEYVRRYSLQDDVKASEIWRAVIGILYDARSEISFTNVPRRGKWGTPTAKAFPTALGSAFAHAIATHLAKQSTE